MEAKDTVMNPKELRAIRERVRILSPELSADREGDIAQVTAENQAEITFPLGKQEGRKEVVEWSNEPCILHGDSDARIRQGRVLRQGNCHECWQAFLKEKGLG